MKTIILFLALAASIFAQGISRLENSPYPYSSQPDTLYKLIDGDYDQAQLLIIGTLQGVLAKTKPMLYRVNSDAYSIWLDDIKQNYGVAVIEEDLNVKEIVTKFKDSINGYILCDLNDNSVNAAISLCGITNCVASTITYAPMFASLGIPKYADVRGKDEVWFHSNYGSQVKKNILCFQNETKSSFLADYSVFGNMMTMFFDSFTESVDTIFSSYKPNTAFLGWGPDEHGTVQFASKYNIFVHAADWANNLSTLTNFNVPEIKQAKPAIHKPDRDAHTVCFLMTDGDNVQWVLSDFMTSQKWYNSPNRGKTNIGWTMSPALSELAPTALKYFYDHEASSPSGRDNFVAGPSGLGYMFPDNFSELSGFASFTNSFMKKSDLRILNILGDNDADSYLSPFLAQPNIDAIFYYFYSNYSGGAGKIKWINNKPVIYGRFNLWENFETPSSLAAKLNIYPTKASSKNAYSLIPVHVWSMDVDDVLDCVSRFDSDVQVVTPDEFVSLIKKNLLPRVQVMNFATNNSSADQGYLLPEYNGTGSDTISRWADYTDKIVYHFNMQDLVAQSAGTKSIILSFNVSHEYVVSVGESLEKTFRYAEWNSDSAAEAHTDSNKAQYTIDIEEYLNQGWKDFYLVLEDGNKSDAFGARIYNITVKAPGSISVGDASDGEIPKSFSLGQNYPNPFNPETTITYNIAASGEVLLNVYDALGRHVKTLVDSFQTPGEHTAVWDGSNSIGQKAASGIYIYKLSANGITGIKKMVMLK
jgi:hypothetical protein